MSVPLPSRRRLKNGIRVAVVLPCQLDILSPEPSLLKIWSSPSVKCGEGTVSDSRAAGQLTREIRQRITQRALLAARENTSGKGGLNPSETFASVPDYRHPGRPQSPFLLLPALVLPFKQGVCCGTLAGTGNPHSKTQPEVPCTLPSCLPSPLFSPSPRSSPAAVEC